MELEKGDKTKRVLNIYDSLNRGLVLKKKELSEKYNVDKRTIQRDFEEIKNYLEENYDYTNLIYDYKQRGYKIENDKYELISGIEIFAFLKIIIESRAFCKEEMNGLINSLLSLSSKIEQKKIKKLIDNEKYYFKELSHKKPILNMMWDLADCIIKKEIIEINFKKSNGEESRRIVYPLSIVFSEFYFYLVAQIEEYQDRAPAFFRLDRIHSFKMLNKKFNEKKRFEDGELKQRVLFMYGGELIHLKFIYSGYSIETVMDRFPTAKVICKNGRGYHIEAEVYGKGCLMWIMSQGENIELLEPLELRNELKEKIENMSKLYKE